MTGSTGHSIVSLIVAYPYGCYCAVIDMFCSRKMNGDNRICLSTEMQIQI